MRRLGNARDLSGKRGESRRRSLVTWRRHLLIQRAAGYVEVKTPQLMNSKFWEASGHWDKYRENMFVTESEKRDYALKPMNCPGHILIYKQGVKSYRDLPLRFGEFGQCHRNEPTGGLHGIMRVRAFTQDDGHIFCTEDQIQSEVSTFIDMLYAVYKDFGFEDVIIKLSTRPENRVGDDSVWDKAEHALELALNNKGLDWDLQQRAELAVKEEIDKVSTSLNIKNGASIALDTNTGEILTMVGSKDFFDKNIDAFELFSKYDA